MSLSRKAILDLKAEEPEQVAIEGLGDISIAIFSAAEADQFFKLPVEGVPNNVSIAILGLCDEKGERLFTSDDAPALSKKPAKIMTDIARAIMSHNGLGADAEAEAKNGSSETGSDDSSSGSLPTSEEPLQN